MKTGSGHARWRDPEPGYEPTMADMMSSVDAAAVWSILDQQGTQNMMRSALGDAAKIADYETIKKRVLGSCYTHGFFQRREFRSDGCDLGFDHRGDAVHGDEGRHHVQEDERHAG